MIQAQINVKEFVDMVSNLDPGNMERIAVTFPDLFGKDCFDFVSADGGATQRPTKPQPAPSKPRERKPREPKGLSDREVEIVATVYAHLKQNNGARPADINVGVTPDERKAALKVLVREGKVRCEGKAGGARYYLVEQGEA